MNKIFSSRSSYFLKRMQKAVILRAHSKLLWCSDFTFYIINGDSISVTLALVSCFHYMYFYYKAGIRFRILNINFCLKSLWSLCRPRDVSVAHS